MQGVNWRTDWRCKVDCVHTILSENPTQGGRLDGKSWTKRFDTRCWPCSRSSTTFVTRRWPWWRKTNKNALSQGVGLVIKFQTTFVTRCWPWWRKTNETLQHKVLALLLKFNNFCHKVLALVTKDRRNALTQGVGLVVKVQQLLSQGVGLGDKRQTKCFNIRCWPCCRSSTTFVTRCWPWWQKK